MCFRNSPGINLVASTMSHDAGFTLICSQDFPFPRAFQLHWERTSRTKVRKLMSLAQDSLTDEGKRKKTKWDKGDHSPSPTGRAAEQWPPSKLELHCLLPLPKLLLLSMAFITEYGISLWPVQISCCSQLHWKAESASPKASRLPALEFS